MTALPSLSFRLLISDGRARRVHGYGGRPYIVVVPPDVGQLPSSSRWCGAVRRQRKQTKEPIEQGIYSPRRERNPSIKRCVSVRVSLARGPRAHSVEHIAYIYTPRTRSGYQYTTHKPPIATALCYFPGLTTLASAHLPSTCNLPPLAPPISLKSMASKSAVTAG